MYSYVYLLRATASKSFSAFSARERSTSQFFIMRMTMTDKCPAIWKLFSTLLTSNHFVAMRNHVSKKFSICQINCLLKNKEKWMKKRRSSSYLRNRALLWKRLPHFVQQKDLSLLWTQECLIKLRLSLQILPHITHMFGDAFSMWLSLTCSTRSASSRHLSPHIKQRRLGDLLLKNRHFQYALHAFLPKVNFTKTNCKI